MLSKTVGRVTIVTESAKGFSTEALELAGKLKNCFAQKAPWKNYNAVLSDEAEELGYLRLEEIGDTDYVDWIKINDTTKTIRWGQGDFVVGCSLNDLEIDTSVFLEQYERDVDRIRIGVKPNGTLILEDFSLIKIYKVPENGFIGINTDQEDKYVEIAPMIVLHMEDIEEAQHEEGEEFNTEHLLLVDRATIWGYEENTKHLNDWASSCGFDCWRDLLFLSHTSPNTVNKIDYVMYGYTNKEPDIDSLEYVKTVDVAYVSYGRDDDEGDPEYCNTIEFIKRAIFKDKHGNYWANGRV